MNFKKLSLLFAGLLIASPSKLFSVNLRKVYKSYTDAIAANNKAQAIQIFDQQILPALGGRDPQAREVHIQEFMQKFYPGNPLESRDSTLAQIDAYLQGQAANAATAQRGPSTKGAYEAANKALQNKIDQLEKELAHTKDVEGERTDLAQSRVMELEQDLAEIKAALNDAIKSGKEGAQKGLALKKALEQIDRLEEQLSAAQAGGTAQGETNAQLQARIAELQQQLDAAREALERANQTSSAHVATRTAAEEERDEAQETNTQLQAQLADLQAVLDAAKAQAGTHASQNESLMAAVETLQSEKAELARVLGARNSTHEGTIAQLETQVKDLTGKLATLEAHNKRNFTGKTEAEQQLAELQEKLAATENTVKTFSREKKELKAQLAATEKKLEEATMYKSKFEGLQESSETSKAILQETIKDLNTELQAAHAKGDKSEELEAAQKELERLQQKITDTTKLAAGDRNTLEKRMKDLAEEKAGREQAEATIAELQEQLEAALSKKGADSGELQAALAEVERLKEQDEANKREALQQQAIRDGIEKDAQAKVDAAEAKAEKLLEENKELHNQVEKHEADLTEHQRTYADAAKTHEETQQDLADTQAKLKKAQQALTKQAQKIRQENRDTINRIESEKDVLQDTLAALQKEKGTTKAEHADAIANLQAEINKLQAQVGEAEGKHLNESAAHEKTQTALEEAQTALARQDTQGDELLQELAALRAKLEASEGEKDNLQGLQAELKEAEQNVKVAAEAGRALAEQNQELREKLKTVTASSKAHQATIARLQEERSTPASEPQLTEEQQQDLSLVNKLKEVLQTRDITFQQFVEQAEQQLTQGQAE